MRFWSEIAKQFVVSQLLSFWLANQTTKSVEDTTFKCWLILFVNSKVTVKINKDIKIMSLDIKHEAAAIDIVLVSIVNFEHILHLGLVFLFVTLNR